MGDNYVFTQDSGQFSFESVSVDGITVDDDGSASFDWNEVPVVELREPPHARAFDTDQFYKIEDVTTARPIKQPYRKDGDVVWLKKPADELRDAAWSMDNRPYTLSHPDTGMVKDVHDVHGFWKDPHYDDDEDRLKEDLYVPVNDDEAISFIEDNQDVSIGFYNREVAVNEYDGDTGDLTDDDVDGFQVNIYTDHIAGVKRGRCSSNEGCGIEADADQHGHIVTDATTTFLTQSKQTESEESDSDEGVESADDSTLDSDTRSEEDSTNDSADKGSGADKCSPCDATMTDKDDDTFSIDIDVSDVTLDSLAEEFDAVADLKAERDSYVETVEEIEEDLDEHGIELEEDDCPCEAVDEILHDKEDLESRIDDLESELDEYRSEEIDERLDGLEELGADRDEWEDADLDEIEAEIDRREEVLETVDDVETQNINTDSGGDENESGGGSSGYKRSLGRGYAAGPQTE